MTTRSMMRSLTPLLTRYVAPNKRLSEKLRQTDRHRPAVIPAIKRMGRFTSHPPFAANQLIFMNSNDPYLQDHLAHRLMAAVRNGSVRKVAAYLKSGANPNWPDPNRIKTVTIGGGKSQAHWPVIFPLQLLPFMGKPAKSILILELLLAAGADLNLYFCWMSANGVFLENRIQEALNLCKLIHGWKHKLPYEKIVKWWLAKTSMQINQWPEPSDADLRKNHIKLHQCLGSVCSDYHLQHKAALWALSEIL